MKPKLKEDLIIEEALQILEGRLRKSAHKFENPKTTSHFLALKFGQKEMEIFAVLFLDNRHQLIECKEMFFGTIDGASVHPREVLKEAIKQNAAAVILAHNHPSGVSDPSQSDIRITEKIKAVLECVDIKVLDHFIVGGRQTTSFAERGLI